MDTSATTPQDAAPRDATPGTSNEGSGPPRQQDLEHADCAICGDQPGELWGQHYEGYRIVRCPKCRLRWVSPRPSSSHVEEGYDEAWEGYFEATTPHVDKWRTWADGDLQTLERILPHLKSGDPRILDVGCGIGHFLIMAKAIGFGMVEGSELSGNMKEHLESFGIPLHVGSIEDLIIGPYDLVTAQHVLEHLTDPSTFLKAIHEITAPGGVLHLMLPNEGSFVSNFKSFLSRIRLKRRRFKHLAPGHHLYFYDKATLKKMLETHGFRVLDIHTVPGPKRRNPIVEAGLSVLKSLDWCSTLEVIARRTN